MCKSCVVLTINGVKCHETGCPDAWMDEERDCKWCGCSFKPEDRNQNFCDDQCFIAYHN